MGVIEKFKKSSLLKYGASVLAGSALTIAAVATVVDIPKFNMHGLGVQSKAFDPIKSINGLKGDSFYSRSDREATFENAMNEVPYYAGGIYLVYDPNNTLDAQIVMPSERNHALPDPFGGVIKFGAYSDAVQAIIKSDQESIEEFNAQSKSLKLDKEDPKAVRVVTLMDHLDNDFIKKERYHTKPVGFKTLATEFSQKVGGYDGNSIYRLESKVLGFGCTLTFDDKTGNLTGQDCVSKWGKAKTDQLLAKLDNS